MKTETPKEVCKRTVFADGMIQYVTMRYPEMIGISPVVAFWNSITQFLSPARALKEIEAERDFWEGVAKRRLTKIEELSTEKKPGDIDEIVRSRTEWKDRYLRYTEKILKENNIEYDLEDASKELP